MHIQFVLSICRLASKLDLLVWQIVSMALSALDRHLLCTVQKHVMTSSRVDRHHWFLKFMFYSLFFQWSSAWGIGAPDLLSSIQTSAPDISRPLQIFLDLSRSLQACLRDHKFHVIFSKGNIEVCLSPWGNRCVTLLLWLCFSILQDFAFILCICVRHLLCNV